MGQYFKCIFLGELSLNDSILSEVRGEQPVGKIIGYINPYDYDNGAKLMEHSWVGNHMLLAAEALLSPKGKFNKVRVVWGGDYAEPETDMAENLYELCDSAEELANSNPVNREAQLNKYQFIINHDKQLYVDLTKIPVSNVWTSEDGVKYPFIVHPLPILTNEGNGDEAWMNGLSGTWARNSISVDNFIPDGYNELEFNLIL